MAIAGLDTLRELILDRRKFIETLFLIQSKERAVVPFVLKPAQAELHRLKTNRNIIMKARQLGFSSYILADMLAEAITVPNTACVCISHEEKSTQRLFARLKFMYDNIPDQLKVPADHSSSYELTFPDIGSMIYIGTARAPVFGRGDTINILHLSELSRYPEGKADELIISVTQAVPMGGTIYIESSPAGRGGVFYKIYQQALSGGEFKPFFFPWWWDSEYLLPEGSPLVKLDDRGRFEPSDEEQALMLNHNLTLNQIRWRRYKIAQLVETFGGSFRNEYPENDIDCWLTAERAVFNTDRIRTLISRARPPLTEHSDNFLRVWQLPRGDARYIIGVDPAQGVASGDFSVAVVLEKNTLRHCATLRGRLPTDLFTQKLHSLASKYNNAVVVVENSGGFGEACLTVLERLGYSNIYKDKTKRGWSTNLSTRPMMLEELGMVINSLSLQTDDTVLLDELIGFQVIDGKAQAPADSHDDCIFALMVALIVRNKYLPLILTPRPPIQRYAVEVL